MHCFGHPGDIDAILSICERYELPLIEDAAESLGSFYKGKHTGRFGVLSAVSFNGNKIITTGGGGAILTDDVELAQRAKHLTTTAKTAHPWEFYHDAVAWNFRLPNINAALGVAQLEILPSLLRAKRELALSYEKVFAELSDEVEFLREPADSHSNYWLNCVLLKPEQADQRDAILQALNDSGYQSRPLWRPMHVLPMYANAPRGPLPVTEVLCARAINIPSSADLRPIA
jgi:perosamine synthetase